MATDRLINQTQGDAIIEKLDDIANKINTSNNISEEFSATTAYAVGDYCVYKNELYRCTTAHTGAWNASDFASTTVMEEVEDKDADIRAALDLKADTTTVSSLTDRVEAVEEVTESGSEEVTVDYAEVVTVNDALGVNAVDVKAKIEPVQDLHGYDKPWVGGAGKNLLPLSIENIKNYNRNTWNGNTTTIYGVEFTIQTDNNNVVGINVNGTLPSSSSRISFKVGEYTIGNMPVVMNGCPQNGSSSTFGIVAFSNNDAEYDYGNGIVLTSFSTGNTVNILIIIRPGYTANNLVFKPMIRLATETDPTFEPYSNICPITGWDEVNVTRSGKNQLPLDLDYIKSQNPSPVVWNGNVATRNGVTQTFNDDGTVLVNGTADGGSGNVVLIKNVQLDPNKTYKLVGCPSVGGGQDTNRLLVIYDNNGQDGYYTDFGNGVEFSGVFIKSVTLAIERNSTANNMLFKPMLTTDLTATYSDFEQFKANDTYTISLNGTRYGGTLDVTTGVLTLTHGYERKTNFDYKSSSSQNNNVYRMGSLPNCRNNYAVSDKFTWHIFAEVTTASIYGFCFGDSSQIGRDVYCGLTLESGLDTLEKANQWLTDNGGYVDFVYELATPQTIQLTPTQIKMLQGNNTLFADSGDTQLTYYNSTIGNIGEAVGELDNDKANKSDLTSINVTGTTNSTGSTIASGTYFYLNDVLVKAKADIASGATFTKNTNYEEVTAGALNKLNDALVTVETNYQSVKLMHNIPRLEPKDITSYISDGTFWKRLNGTDGYELFEDIYVGDYWEMTEAISAYNQNSQYQATGSKYVTIAGIDMHYSDGDGGDSVSVITYHHVDVVAGQGFGGTQHFGRSRMNSSNTTTGGYVGSEMHTTTIGAVTTTGKRASTDATATINEQLYAEFGSHLKTQRCLLSNAMDSARYNRFGQADGASSGWAWASVQAVLMTEIECYGSIVWSSSGYDTGNGNKQLPLFAHSKQAMNNRTAYYWLRDVASSANFCNCDSYGFANCTNASAANVYVRPRFILA